MRIPQSLKSSEHAISLIEIKNGRHVLAANRAVAVGWACGISRLGAIHEGSVYVPKTILGRIGRNCALTCLR